MSKDWKAKSKSLANKLKEGLNNDNQNWLGLPMAKGENTLIDTKPDIVF